MIACALPCDILKLTPTTEGRWRERWEVRGDSGAAYIVSRDIEGAFGCSCPHWKFRRERCKHIDRLAYYVGSSTMPPEPATMPESKPAARRLRCEVSQKGAISVYGLMRFPVTLYLEQWIDLLGFGTEIVEFIEANADRLKKKGES